MTETVSTAPITFDNVLQALGEIDPNETNASKIRAILGRGSFATIQKHLDSIRTQKIQSAQPTPLPVPPAPPELLSLWSSAVAVATAQVRTRLDDVVALRDTLSAELQTSRSDVLALTGDLEMASARAEGAVADLAMALQAVRIADEARANDAAASLRALAAAEQSYEAKLATLRFEVEEAKHRAEKADLEAQLGERLLQSTIDRLTDQVGELKSLLHTNVNTTP